MLKFQPNPVSCYIWITREMLLLTLALGEFLTSPFTELENQLVVSLTDRHIEDNHKWHEYDLFQEHDQVQIRFLRHEFIPGATVSTYRAFAWRDLRSVTLFQRPYHLHSSPVWYWKVAVTKEKIQDVFQMCTSRHHSKNFWRSGKVSDLVDILESWSLQTYAKLQSVIHHWSSCCP